MNTRGEHRAAEPGARSRTPRTATLLLALAVAASGATWAEVHYARSGQVGRVGGGSGTASQDSLSIPDAGTGTAVDNVAALRPGDVLPATVSEPPTPTSPDVYQATRYQPVSSDDCDEALTIAAPADANQDCTGYLTADYVAQDRSVYTSVTVFLYSGAAAAARVAKALNSPAAIGAVVFQQPKSGLPDAVLPTAPTAGQVTLLGQPSAAGQSGSAVLTPPVAQVRVEAVGSAVDVVESAFADGQPVAGALTGPTWYLAYTLDAKLAWQ
jgi:hypothetical protein